MMIINAIKMIWTLFAVKVLSPIWKWTQHVTYSWFIFRKLKYYNLVYDCIGIKEGSLIPWWGVGIRFLFMPWNTLVWMIIKSKAKRELGYDFCRDVYMIEGLRYTGELFRALGLGEIGSCLRIMKRDDGLLTLQRLINGTVKDGVWYE